MIYSSIIICLVFLVGATGCAHLSPEQEKMLYFSGEYLTTDEIYEKEIVTGNKFPLAGISHWKPLEELDIDMIQLVGFSNGEEVTETMSYKEFVSGETLFVENFMVDHLLSKSSDDLSSKTEIKIKLLGDAEELIAWGYYVDWEKVPKSESIHWKKRSVWHLVSYPVWGLPRDLIDAPFTQLRRWNFDTYKEFVFIGPRGKYEDNAMMEYLGISGMAIGGVGVPVLIAVIITPLWVSIPLAVIAVIPGTIGGLAAGVGINEFLPDSLSWMARNIQAPLLRLNVDSEDFFPNWKFGVHKPVLRDDSDSYEWRVRNNEELFTPKGLGVIYQDFIEKPQ